MGRFKPRVLATVNGVGDFVSSAMVGVLWTALGTSVAFGYSAELFSAGGRCWWREFGRAETRQGTLG